MEVLYTCKSGTNQVMQCFGASCCDVIISSTPHTTPVTSATVRPPLEAASRSTWSLPIPAVSASFSLGAFLMRSSVTYAGQKGCRLSAACHRALDMSMPSGRRSCKAELVLATLPNPGRHRHHNACTGAKVIDAKATSYNSLCGVV